MRKILIDHFTPIDHMAMVFEDMLSIKQQGKFTNFIRKFLHLMHQYERYEKCSEKQKISFFLESYVEKREQGQKE